MKFKVDEITSVIREEIRQYRSEMDVAEVGKVLEVGDGIARIYGLSQRHGRRDARVRERRHRPGVQPRGELGRRRSSSATTSSIKEGDEVRRTGAAALACRSARR